MVERELDGVAHVLADDARRTGKRRDETDLDLVLSRRQRRKSERCRGKRNGYDCGSQSLPHGDLLRIIESCAPRRARLARTGVSCIMRHHAAAGLNSPLNPFSLYGCPLAFFQERVAL